MHRVLAEGRLLGELDLVGERSVLARREHLLIDLVAAGVVDGEPALEIRRIDERVAVVAADDELEVHLLVGPVGRPVGITVEPEPGLHRVPRGPKRRGEGVGLVGPGQEEELLAVRVVCIVLGEHAAVVRRALGIRPVLGLVPPGPGDLNVGAGDGLAAEGVGHVGQRPVGRALGHDGQAGDQHQAIRAHPAGLGRHQVGARLGEIEFLVGVVRDVVALVLEVASPRLHLRAAAQREPSREAN